MTRSDMLNPYWTVGPIYLWKCLYTRQRGRERPVINALQEEDVKDIVMSIKQDLSNVNDVSTIFRNVRKYNLQLINLKQL